MASNINANHPADNVKVDKSVTRANFSAAKTEIEQLQEDISVAGQLAIGSLSFS